MKSFIIKSVMLGLMTLSLWSCKKDETKAIAANGTGGEITSSVSAVTISKEGLAADVISFSWKNPSYGYQAAVTNTLQLAVKGSNFATPKEFVLPANVTTKTFTGNDFNTLLLALNLSFSESTAIEARLKSTVSTAVAAVFSSALSLNAKPYPLTAWIYVPGAYQGWDPTTAESLVSPTGNGIYNGVVGFTAGNLMFKITPEKSWDGAYGDAGAGKLSTTGGDIAAPAAGAYNLTVDLNANTIEFKKVVWGLIGDATAGGWDTDSDMTYAKGKWSITTTLKAGELKFRKDHAWDVNIGVKDGVTMINGDNIKITAPGSYTITLDTINLIYTLVKN
ncbi:SusE domain-containing protein [Pedobacter immunditicola]|uniref:SusE domain-containing protein n=1 Tax=Pedobacter immunditicola TaxID=3133440 RepID=UPI0030975CAE